MNGRKRKATDSLIAQRTQTPPGFTFGIEADRHDVEFPGGRRGHDELCQQQYGADGEADP